LFFRLRILMIVGDGAGFDYLVDVLVNLDLNVIEFLRRFQYGLYVIIFTRYCLLKFVLLDLFYHEKVIIQLKELLCFTIKEPEIPHFHSVLTLLHDGAVNNANSCGVVNYYGSWWL
jgi:hypothetical protein